MKLSRHYVLRVDQSRIKELWPMMRENLLSSLPRHQRCEDVANNILYSLSMGQSQLWVGVGSRGEGDADEWFIYGYAMTSLVTDKFAGTRNLLIHMAVSLNGSVALPEMYELGLTKMREFALSQRCDNIIGFTKNEGLTKMVTAVAGADTQYLFTIPVGGS